jgi:hypothetical protein
MLKRVVAACLLAIALTACGAGPPILGPTTGTVSGHLQLRACGGANRPEQTACPTSPMSDATLEFQLVGGSSSSTATTNSAGAYRIDLKPGTYRVRLMEGAGFRTGFLSDSGLTLAHSQAAGSGLAESRTVTVVAGKSVTEDFFYTIQMQ